MCARAKIFLPQKPHYAFKNSRPCSFQRIPDRNSSCLGFSKTLSGILCYFGRILWIQECWDFKKPNTWGFKIPFTHPVFQKTNQRRNSGGHSDLPTAFFIFPSPCTGLSVIKFGYSKLLSYLSMEGSQRKENYKWNPSQERILMNTLLEMKLAGRKVEKNFNAACWKEAIGKIKEKTGLEPSVDNVKNKYKNWRTRYREVKQLLSMSGFGWDDTLKMVTASDDVWDSMEQAKSKLAKYRHITVKFFNEIHDLIDDDVAQGDVALTGTERSEQVCLEMPTDDEFMNDGFHTQTPGLDDMDEANLPQHSVTSPRRTTTPSNQTGTSRSSKRQKSVECEEVRSTLDKVANAVIKLADSVNPLESLISRVSEAVIGHPLIPEDIEMLVFDFLISNDRRALAFLSLNAEKQIKWLEANFHPGSSSRTP